MLKTDLTVETIGSPLIDALTESEKTSLLEALLSGFVELYKESRSQHDAK